MILHIDQNHYYGLMLMSGRLVCGDLPAIIAAMIERPRKPWGIELSSIQPPDEDGVGILLMASGRAMAERIRLALVVPPGPVAAAVMTEGLSYAMPVFDSQTAFIEKCAPVATLAAGCHCALEEHPPATAKRRPFIPIET
jgi:hypothetical protein